jgi:hypothetical protein
LKEAQEKNLHTQQAPADKKKAHSISARFSCKRGATYATLLLADYTAR